MTDYPPATREYLENKIQELQDRLEQRDNPRVAIALAGTDPDTGGRWTEIGQIVEPVTFTVRTVDVDPQIVSDFYSGIDLDNLK